MHPEFAEVPTFHGCRLDYTTSEEEFEFYLAWLADYLYRPVEGVWPLSWQEAQLAVVGIESDMASDLWARSFEEDRINAIGPRHADFLYRADLSRILSLVPSRQKRVELVRWLYQEFSIDARK